MKNSLMSILAIVGFFTVDAQRSAPDVISTKMGDLSIQPITHASLVLTVHGTTIYVDPTGGSKNYTGIAAPDMIIITDIHGDHLDPKTIDSVKKANMIIVVPHAVADKLPAGDKDHLVVLANWANSTQLGIGIAAIPMYNLPESPTASL